MFFDLQTNTFCLKIVHNGKGGPRDIRQSLTAIDDKQDRRGSGHRWPIIKSLNPVRVIMKVGDGIRAAWSSRLSSICADFIGRVASMRCEIV